MGAKQSKLDKLHELFTAELTRQVKDGTTDPDFGERIPPNAALLAVVGAFLNRSGVKPTSDAPNMAELARAHQALPFKATDEFNEVLN